MIENTDWQKAGNALRELHRTLVDVARREYEQSHLIELAPGQLLQLLTSDPAFGWLRGLSELMVDLDLVREFAPAEQDAMAAAARASIEHLLSNADKPAGAFAQRYWPYVHADPRVAMAHAAVKQALNAWPQSELNAAQMLEERHRLAEKARHVSRRR